MSYRQQLRDAMSLYRNHQPSVSAPRSIRLAALLVAIAGLLLGLAWQPVASSEPVQPAAVTSESAQRGVGLSDVVYPPTPGPLQIFGVSSRGEWETASARQRAVDAGAIWVRTSAKWDQVEPVQDVMQFDLLDESFLEFQQLGLIPIVIIMDNPLWASTSICGPLRVGMESEFGEFVSILAQRYNGSTVVNGVTLPRIDYWQIYNEPDIPWTTGTAATFGGCWGMAGDKYAQLLKVAWDAAHAANPHAQIVFGGIGAEDLTCPSSWPECAGQPLFNFDPIYGNDFVGDVFYYIQWYNQQHPGTAFFDVFDFHNYASFFQQWADTPPGLVGKADYYKQRMIDYNVIRPMLSTEAGRRSDSVQVVNGVPGSDEEQSRYVVRMFVQAMQAGLRALTWFTFADDPAVGAWGLLTGWPYDPKPSYTAFRTLTQQLGSVTSITALSLGSTAEGYVFDVPGVGKRSVIWALGSTPYNATFPVAAIRTTDKWGVVFVVKDGQTGDMDGLVNGSVVVQVTGSPLYIDGQPGVANTRPVADFSANPQSGFRPLNVQFANSSVGSSLSYQWSFGDGGTSTQATPNYTYTLAGSYTVVLTATNVNGSDTFTRWDYIKVSSPITPSFSGSPLIGAPPLAVTFTNASLGPVTSNLWSFGDGITSTLPSPTHTYTADGTYTVTLMVTGAGVSETLTRGSYITVTTLPVTSSFSATPLTGHPPLVVTFTNTSTGTISSYLWSYGDGITSTTAALTHTHTYTAAGSYTVTLAASGGGGSDTMTKTNYIKPYSFDDVPPTHPSWLAIEAVKRAGVTAGCNISPPLYCPTGLVKREEIAVFIDRALGWPAANPVQGVFTDLAANYWATPFAETLYAHGVTAGCQAAGQPLRYCPLYVLSKAEIATMIRAASGWAPVSPPQYIFADAGPGDWFTPHVEAFYAHTPGSQCGTDPGSGKLLFCPNSQVSRAYMAELLASAFGL